MSVVPVTSQDLDAAEVAWFAALCSDDYRYLGVPDGSLRSSWAHCSDIVKTAEELGFSQHTVPVLLPGRAGHAFLRRGLCPDHLEDQHAGRRALRRDAADHAGAHRHARPHAGRPADSEHHLVGLSRRERRQPLSLPALARWCRYCARRGRATRSTSRANLPLQGLTTAPARPYPAERRPLLYFEGYSPDALELCAERCDVYLMWPETKELAARMKAVHERAAKHGRTLDYGLRVHDRARHRGGRRGNMPASSSPGSTTSRAGRFASGRWMQSRSAFRTRRRTASWPMPRAMSSRVCGPVSAGQGPDAGRPWWARPTRCCRRSRPI